MHISNLKPWDLYSVLTQKYCWSSKEAREFSEFLVPMLDYDTRRRATSLECLNSDWIKYERPARSVSNKSSEDKIKSPKSSISNQGGTSTSSNKERYQERKNEKHNKSREINLDNNSNLIDNNNEKYSSKSSYSAEHEILIIEK